MSKPLLEYLQARLAATQIALDALQDSLESVLRSRAARDRLGASMAAARDAAGAAPLPALVAPWGEERRAKVAAGVSRAWQARQAGLRLYLFSWAGEEPGRVTYEEAADLLDLAPSTLRVKISTSPSHSIAVYRAGRYQVLARRPDGLEPALQARALATGDAGRAVALERRAPLQAGGRAA